MIAPAPPIVAALAREHEAVTLAAALAARLIADGRAELAAGVAALLSGAGDAVASLNPNPPSPHREGSTS